MRKSAEEIAELYNSRVKLSGAAQQVMREVATLYDNEIVVPLPEMQADELPAVANVARQGIDQTAMRAATVFPEIGVYPVTTTQAGLDRARNRRRAFYHFHEQNKTKRKMRRWARYMIAYAQAPIRIRPDFAGEMPRIDMRSPLGTYANPSGDPDDFLPSDCIFAKRQTLGWLSKYYPEQRALLGMDRGDRPDTPIDVIEYVDAYEIVTLATRRAGEGAGTFHEGWNEAVTEDSIHLASACAILTRVPNRAERPLAIVPGAISLSKQKSPYANITGMYQRAAQMDALAFIATKQGILGETWLQSHPNETPELLAAPNPYEGEAGVVKGGNLVFRTTPPQFVERTAVSDLERAQRLTAGVPPELGGEAATGVRTGRRSDQLLSAVLDFPMAELHEIAEEVLEAVNGACASIDHAYFPASKKDVYVEFQGERGRLSYEPGKLWKGPDGECADHSKVSYFAAGMDAQDRIIALGQRMGMGTISTETAMRHDPLVDDVQGEISRVNGEKLDRVIETRVQTLAADPNSPVSIGDLTSLKAKVREGASLDEAWVQVEEEIAKRQQEAQAQQAAPPGPATLPGEPEIAPQIQGPPEDLQNLNSLLLSARGPSFTTPQG